MFRFHTEQGPYEKGERTATRPLPPQEAAKQLEGYGSKTVSRTWIVPFEAMTSVAMTPIVWPL